MYQGIKWFFTLGEKGGNKGEKVFRRQKIAFK